jgi:ankyrin repeat protein
MGVLRKTMEFTRRASDAVTDNIRAFADEAARRLVNKKKVKFSLDVVLHEVVIQGNVNEMRDLLIQHGQELLEKFDSNGVPLGVRAVHSGQFEMFQFLVSQGYDLSLADEEGWTALHMAASMNDTATVAFILLQSDSHKLTTAKTALGKRPMDVCETAEVASFLVQSELDHFSQNLSSMTTEGNSTSESSQRNSEEETLVKFVTKNRTNGKQLGEVCSDLLHVAAVKNYPKLAYTILQFDLADINSMDKNGWTALHIAAYYGNVDVALLLLQCGIEVRDRPIHPSKMTKNAIIFEALANLRELL